MLPVQFALAAPPSDRDSIGLISHLPLAVQFPLGATRSISMLTRVIREMQLSLISMLTRSQRVLRIYKSTVNRFRKWLPLPACQNATRIASTLLTEVQTL